MKYPAMKNEATLERCGGIQSPVNPSRPLRLCLDCVRFQFAESLIKPSAHRAGGDAWVCDSMISSVPASAGIVAGAGTDTAPAIFLGGGESAGQHRAAEVCDSNPAQSVR